MNDFNVQHLTSNVELSSIDRDALVEKVNQAILAPCTQIKRRNLRILLGRYLGGERSDDLFKAMKIETAD
jgi:hypothetical protein